MSAFPVKKALDDFDFSFQPSIDKHQIDELATMRFLLKERKEFVSQKQQIVNTLFEQGST